MRSYFYAISLLLLGPNAGVVAQLFPSEGCSICPSSLPEVGLPDEVLPDGFAGVLENEQTCAETEEQAQSGAFSQASCVLLRASGISSICGCQEGEAPTAPVPVPVPAPVPVPVPVPVPEPVPVAAPTDAPEPEPTDAPVSALTDAPVAAPTDAPVAAPTDAPEPVPVAAPTVAPVEGTSPPTGVPVPGTTTAPTPPVVTTMSPTVLNVTTVPSVTVVPVAPPSGTVVPAATPTPPPVDVTEASAQVSIRIINTKGPLSGNADATETYIAACSEFYSEFLSGSAMNVSCSIPSRRELQKYHLRAAQAVAPLDVLTEVTAMFDTSGGVVAFENELISIVMENNEKFVTLLRTRGSDVSKAFFDQVTTVEAYDTTAVPPIAPVATAPTPSASAPTAPVPPPTAVEDDDGLSTGAIAGIAVGAVGGVALIALLLVSASKSNPTPVVRQMHTDPVGEDFPAPAAAPKPQAPMFEKEPAPMPPPAAAAAVTTAAVAAAAGTGDGNKDGMSVMTGSEMDAYSLDAGNVDQPSSAPGTKRDATDGMSQSGDEMSSHAMSSLRQNMVSRTVIAPPGKLGIVIDTTLEGPVVHKINPQSPLEGTLFPGDIIVAIDDVDTRAMSASAITALMVRTANLRRKLTVLSEDVTN